MYRVAVCDDDAGQAEKLKMSTERWAEKTGNRVKTDCFPSAEAFLFDYSGDENCDILLLDVEMEKMSGIELAKRLRKMGCRAEIIFITSHFEFVSEGYEVDALHYLIKPVPDEKLSEILTRAAEKLASEPQSVLVNPDGETVKLYEPDILYAESFLHYLAIHTTAGEYRIKENISDFGKKLSPDFFRVHRSYIVNLTHIVRIGRTSVTLDSGSEIPVARGKYDAINRAFIERN